MNYLDLEDIYKKYRKETSIALILWKYKQIQFTICIILSSIWVVLFTCWAFYKKQEIIIIALLVYIASLIFIIKLGYDTIYLIKTLYKMNSKYIHSGAYLNIMKSKVFLSILKDCDIKIKNKKQKELLINILNDEADKYKVAGLWIKGILAALTIPIWSNYTYILMNNPGKQNTNILNNIIGAMLLIIICAWIVNRTIFKDILVISNKKFQAFKEMARIIQEDLMFNEYLKNENVLSGEMIIKKI